MNPSQNVFPYLLHRLSTEPAKNGSDFRLGITNRFLKMDLVRNKQKRKVGILFIS